MFQEAATWKI